MNDIKSLNELSFDGLRIDNAFWQFSLRAWQQPALQKALLSLQDEHDLRVNHILLAMWLGLEKKNFVEVMAHQTQTLDVWHNDVVSVLRQLRKQLPKQQLILNLRGQIQASELQAEQWEQAMLFELSGIVTTQEGEKTMDIFIKNLLASAVPHSHLLLLTQEMFPMQAKARIQACIDQIIAG